MLLNGISYFLINSGATRQGEKDLIFVDFMMSTLKIRDIHCFSSLAEKKQQNKRKIEKFLEPEKQRTKMIAAKHKLCKYIIAIPLVLCILHGVRSEEVAKSKCKYKWKFGIAFLNDGAANIYISYFKIFLATRLMRVRAVPKVQTALIMEPAIPSAFAPPTSPWTRTFRLRKILTVLKK